MNIAIVSDGENLENKVSQNFEACKYLLIVSMPDLNVNSIKNEGNSDYLTSKVIEYDCEATITGELSKESFNILADAYITRFFGFGNTVEKALELMDKNLLKLIRNLDGTEECSGNHNH